LGHGTDARFGLGVGRERNARGFGIGGDTPSAQLHGFEGCWRGVFQGESGVTDIRCFEPMLGGQYMRDTHVVHGGQGAYSGETIYYLDAQTHLLSYAYYASDGGVMRGTASVDEHGVTFPAGQYVDTDGSTLTLRSTWRRDGADRYVAVAEMEDHGQWRPHTTITYVRAPELSPPAQ
jgi:hypothetical protein